MSRFPAGNSRCWYHRFPLWGKRILRNLCWKLSRLVVRSAVRDLRRRLRDVGMEAHLLKTQICAQSLLSHGLERHVPRTKILSRVSGLLQSRFGIHVSFSPQQESDPGHTFWSGHASPL